MDIEFKQPLKDNCALHEVFNLSLKRAKQITTIIKNNIEEDPLFLTTIPILLKETNSIEEYTFACLAIGGWIHYYQNKNAQ